MNEITLVDGESDFRDLAKRIWPLMTLKGLKQWKNIIVALLVFLCFRSVAPCNWTIGNANAVHV
jgi:hypothetical protein